MRDLALEHRAVAGRRLPALRLADVGGAARRATIYADVALAAGSKLPVDAAREERALFTISG